jgi:GT2 family glycosyltransferase
VPLFSVIIPAFNRATLIGQTLQSVLSQEAPDLEVIVVDDGSTDGTPDVVRGFGDRVKLLHQENKGPGAARNLGLKAATGEYVAFLDSDDIWFRWTAATYRSLIDQHNRPAFIVGKPFVFQTQSDPLPTAPASLTTEVFADYYTSGDQWRWFSASSFVMRRDLFIAAGGFTDDWVNAEDADAAMRMGVAGKFVQITSPHTFAYRQHEGSAMTNLDRTLAGILRLIHQEESAQFPGGPERALERRRIILTYARPLCVDLLGRGQRASAWDLYRRTFQWNLSLHRWKFLLGFPTQAVARRLRGR